MNWAENIYLLMYYHFEKYALYKKNLLNIQLGRQPPMEVYEVVQQKPMNNLVLFVIQLNI